MKVGMRKDTRPVSNVPPPPPHRMDILAPLFRVFATWIIYPADSTRVRANNGKTCFHDRLTIRRFWWKQNRKSVRNDHVYGCIGFPFRFQPSFQRNIFFFSFFSLHEKSLTPPVISLFYLCWHGETVLGTWKLKESVISNIWRKTRSVKRNRNNLFFFKFWTIFAFSFGRPLVRQKLIVNFWR